MDIFRPIDGVYRNIKDPNDERRYIIRELGAGSYPVLVPVDASPEHSYCYPIPEFQTAEDHLNE